MEPTESEILTAKKLGMTPEEVTHIIDTHMDSIVEVIDARVNAKLAQVKINDNSAK